jgi:hypothetical protein
MDYVSSNSLKQKIKNNQAVGTVWQTFFPQCLAVHEYGKCQVRSGAGEGSTAGAATPYMPSAVDATRDGLSTETVQYRVDNGPKHRYV